MSLSAMSIHLVARQGSKAHVKSPEARDTYYQGLCGLLASLWGERHSRRFNEAENVPLGE